MHLGCLRGSRLRPWLWPISMLLLMIATVSVKTKTTLYIWWFASSQNNVRGNVSEISPFSKAFSEPYKTYTMDLFMKIINDQKLFTIFTKCSIRCMRAFLICLCFWKRWLTKKMCPPLFKSHVGSYSICGILKIYSVDRKIRHFYHLISKIYVKLCSNLQSLYVTYYAFADKYPP